jgi:hypothetical protein
MNHFPLQPADAGAAARLGFVSSRTSGARSSGTGAARRAAAG